MKENTEEQNSEMKVDQNPSQDLNQSQEKQNAKKVQSIFKKMSGIKWVRRTAKILFLALVIAGAYFGASAIVKQRKKDKAFVQYNTYCYDEPNDSPLIYDKGVYSIVDPITQRVIVKDIDWYHYNTDKDSVILFAKKGKRGFYNVSTNKVIVEPNTYTKAWIFSEGLAAVEKDGRIGFINDEGKLVIDCKYSYRGNSLTEFVFHNGYCVVADSVNRIGAIDNKGHWVIKPQYDDVVIAKDYAIVQTKGDFKKQIDFSGNVLHDCIVDYIDNIYYDVTYTNAETGAPEEGKIKNTEYYQYIVGAYSGLINSKGEFITPPIYTHISGVTSTVFCATLKDGYSKVLINQHGEVVSKKR